MPTSVDTPLEISPISTESQVVPANTVLIDRQDAFIDCAEFGRRMNLPESWVREHVRLRSVDPIPAKTGVANDADNRLEWLTAKEAAKYLKTNPRTLLLWVRQGKVKGYVLSGVARRTWRFRRADLDAALIESRANIHPAVRAL